MTETKEGEKTRTKSRNTLPSNPTVNGLSFRLPVPIPSTKSVQVRVTDRFRLRRRMIERTTFPAVTIEWGLARKSPLIGRNAGVFFCIFCALCARRIYATTSHSIYVEDIYST